MLKIQTKNQHVLKFLVDNFFLFEMVYMSNIQYKLDLRWLTMLIGHKVNIKVVVLDKTYNFAIHIFFIGDHFSLECQMC